MAVLLGDPGRSPGSLNRGAGLGDFNGDGVPDFGLGAPYADGPALPGVGRVFVIFGGEDLVPQFIPAAEVATGGYGLVTNGSEVGAAYGHAVSGGGDLNHDGLGDLLVGAYEASPGGRSGAGRAYVVFGHGYEVGQ